MTTADAEPAPQAYPVAWVRRGRSAPVRHLAVARAVARAARACGRRLRDDDDPSRRARLVPRAAPARRQARRRRGLRARAPLGPVRGHARGLPGARAAGSASASCARRAPLRSAAPGGSSSRAPTCATSLSAGALYRSGSSSSRTRRRRSATLPSREEARAALGITGPTLGTAGRLTAQKALGDALAAVARVDGVSLVVLGDGPERVELERRTAELGLSGRVRFLGAGTRDDVVRLFRAVDAALLTSAWENLPHTVLEALAVGTPVIATAVGGVPEVVQGRRERPARPGGRRRGDRRRDRAAPARRLAPGAGSPPRRRRPSRSSPSRVSSAGSWRRSRKRFGEATRPHGRPDPLPAPARALRSAGSSTRSADRLRLRVLGAAPRGAPSAGTTRSRCSAGRRCAALDAPAFYGALPLRIARELRREPADAILAQSPYEALAAFAGRALARSDSAVVVEIHGDWRTWARLYGSPARGGRRAARRPRGARRGASRGRRSHALGVHDADGARRPASSRRARSRPTPT